MKKIIFVLILVFVGAGVWGQITAADLLFSKNNTKWLYDGLLDQQGVEKCMNIVQNFTGNNNSYYTLITIIGSDETSTTDKSTITMRQDTKGMLFIDMQFRRKDDPLTVMLVIGKTDTDPAELRSLDGNLNLGLTEKSHAITHLRIYTPGHRADLLWVLQTFLKSLIY